MKTFAAAFTVLGLITPSCAFAATDVVSMEMSRQAPRSSFTENFRTTLGTLRFNRKRQTDVRTLYVVIEGEAQKAFAENQGKLSSLLTEVELRNVGTRRIVPAVLSEETHAGKKTRAVYAFNDFLADNGDSWEIQIHAGKPFGLRTLKATACGMSDGPVFPCINNGSTPLKSVADDMITGSSVLFSPGVVQFGTVIMRGK